MIERRKSRLWAVAGLFDQLHDGVCIADEAGALLYVNPAARRLLELPEHPESLESICRLLCERLDGPGVAAQARRCPLRDAQAPGLAGSAMNFLGKHGPRSVFRWEGETISRSDRWRDLRVRCMTSRLALEDVEENLHLVLIEDASAELELQRHKEDWRAMIAHDLRAPLTSVHAGLRLLEQGRAGAKPGPDAEVVRMGLRSCLRMMELLDLYLDVARFDARAADVALQPVNVFDAVDGAVAEQAALAASRSTVVEIDVPPGLWATADRDLLRRVLGNLVNNAIKYGDAGARVRVGAIEDAQRVRVSVKDDGPGIEEKLLPLLFDRYYQAEARRAGRIKGNGLGLTFCREAVKLMNGEIFVKSAPGEGAEFTVSLSKADAPVR